MKQTFEEFISFELQEIKKGITLIYFTLKRDIEPKDLKDINPPDPVKNRFSQNLVILSGRGPIWLYGFLIHFYHPVRAIAVFDPRLDSAVIIESHTIEFRVGDITKVEDKR